TVAQAVIDFIYYASFPSQSSETLWRMQDALKTFHQYKDVFVQHGTRTHFHILKIHAMEYYIDLIHSKGSADGFNTELSECLHIDCAKQGYCTSNKKNYTEQMVWYLTQHEGLDLNDDQDEENTPILLYPSQTGHITKSPPWPQRPVRDIITKHEAINFVPALSEYLRKHVPHNIVQPSETNLIDVYK
ncbi:hypothetical protein M422DRAFT_86503, partial [Sphaerobolus stellatus SS14]